MGRSGQKHLDRLIDEVAHGKRELSSIADRELREAVRIALRLHAEAPSVPDAYTKARMRARVMAGLDPRGHGLRDSAWIVVELLARPAPYIVRGIAAASVAICLALAGFVASADTLPDDLLYSVKIGAEQVRLALAGAPADRASVELSIAEHRLFEAEQLAAVGRTSDALVASAFYSQHVATAAAELGADAESDLSSQLESRFTAQRERAASLAISLSMNVNSERASQVLAMIATSPLAPGSTRVERVAESAVTLAADLASAAESAAVVAPRATEAPRVSDAASDARAAATDRSVATARVTATDRVTQTAHPVAAAPDPHASDAAKAAREAAAKARAAADKLKHAMQKGNSGHK